jgi:anti-sigma regulatory factor (Ser/Thr protein kinase)
MKWAFASEDAEKAHHARDQFMTALRLRAPNADYTACEMIFGELVGNVVRHAPGQIRILLDWTGDEALLYVEDGGASFNFNPHLPLDPLAESGRGLYLVSALALPVR